MEKDGVTKADILRLNSLNVRGLVVFTAHDYPDIPYTCFIKKYEKSGSVGNILLRSIGTMQKNMSATLTL